MFEESKPGVALITGAGRGIGAATARLLAGAGKAVVLAARTAAEIEAVAAEIRAGQGAAEAVVCDVRDDAQVRAAVAAAEALGPLDILINNAGVCRPARLVDCSDEDFRATIEGNLHGVFFACRAALPGMLARGRGCIVNVASISGVRMSSKFPGFTAYAAAKAGVIALTEALAAEVGEDGLRVNAVSPGSVDTRMLREAAPGAEPGMSPEEVAAAIAFLCGDASHPMNGRNLELF